MLLNAFKGRIFQFEVSIRKKTVKVCYAIKLEILIETFHYVKFKGHRLSFKF